MSQLETELMFKSLGSGPGSGPGSGIHSLHVSDISMIENQWQPSLTPTPFSERR